MSHLDPLFNIHCMLRQQGRQPSPVVNNRFTARCPVASHGRGNGDRNPSLSVGLGRDWQVLMKCHAGCSFDDIRDALGISPGELTPPDEAAAPRCSRQQVSHNKAGGPGDRAAKQPVTRVSQDVDNHQHHDTRVTSGDAGMITRATQTDGVIDRATQNQNTQPERTIDEVYRYRDADHNLLFEVLRYRPKAFRQRRPDPDRPGDYIYNLHGVNPVLFNLPEIVADRKSVVHICEGEKDAERMARFGYLATTAPMGAGKWKPSYSKWLAGRAVLILQDSDKPGAEHAHSVAEQLAGVAKSVRVVPPFDGARDVSDWLDQGHTEAELAAHLARADVQPPVEPSPGEATKEAAGTLQTLDGDTLMDRELPEPVWVVPKLLPEGLAILAGRPKSGKSWMALSVALAVARGSDALGIGDAKRGEVLLLALEDNERRLQERVQVLRRDDDRSLRNLRLVTGHSPNLLELDRWLHAHPDCKLVIIDTFGRFRKPQEKQASLYEHDTNAADSLQRLAFKHNLCVLLIHHTRKQVDDADPLVEISGSFGLSGAADTLLVLRRKREDQHAELFITGRDVNEERLGLRFHKAKDVTGTDKLPGWVFTNQPLVEASTPERQQLLDLLAQADGPMQLKDIADKVGKDKAAVRRMLGGLVEDGHVVQPSFGKYRIAVTDQERDQSSQSDQSSVEQTLPF